MTSADHPNPSPITSEMLTAAESLAALRFTDAEHALMSDGVLEQRANYEKLRTIPLDNSVAPAFTFDPRLPAARMDAVPTVTRAAITIHAPDVPPLPADLEEVAFWPLTWLAHLIETHQVTSAVLTEMYLARLKRYDPTLLCVVSLTEDLAHEQAARADAEIAAGQYRGALHGIPWGVKDLLATRGTRTTWGAEPFQDQRIDMNATVVDRLEAAGAVLLAKLSVGALAMGDIWFGGTTKSPWDVAQGSSGSSAGSGAATAAGLVGFAIGTETLGSIISPATRCHVTGLRPTFGRVSRHGAMALSWTMDKIGPMARSVEDCALIFNAIYGPDGKDPTVTDYPFAWPSARAFADLRIGYLKDAFEEDNEFREANQAALEVFRTLGANLIPIHLPDYPVNDLGIILTAEAAASFDELTRTNRDDLLSNQAKDAWPTIFRQARLIPAVEYIQAQRIRTLLIRDMAALMDTVDVYIAPSFGGNTLMVTNLTGHPAVVVPNGLSSKTEPSSLTVTGQLYGEAEALLVAQTYQNATAFHRERPTLDPSSDAG